MFEEELDLMLSQSQQHETLSPDVDDDEDFSLQLSQSQPPTQQMALADESTVSDVANLTDSATSVKLSINLVQNMIQKNHELLIKQNIELSEMMSELSVNVADMNDRVVSLEKKFLSTDTKVEINRVNLLEVTDKINEMQNSLKCIKKKQTVSGETQHIVPNNKLERRLQLIEEKLSMTCPSTSKAEEMYTLQIMKLPFGQKDNEDVNKLLRTGLGLHMKAKTVDRARSINNNAGIITLGLRSGAEKEQVMRSKHKLRYTDSYYDVYIDDGVEQRIQQKLQVLMNTMKGLQQQVPSPRNAHPQRNVQGHRPRRNGYHHSD